MNGYSDYLFARPSFGEGWARLFDFGNVLTEYNVSRDGAAADARAFAADWRAVGADVREAMKTYERTAQRGR